jgi:Peptidase A4 family
MKKFLVGTVLYFAAVSYLPADILTPLNNYTNVDCTFKERSKSHKKHAKGHSHPHMPIEKGSSINWSGYASATNIDNPVPGTVTAVNGTWVVPQLKATSNDSSTALWVGIDGYSSPTVEQLGTEHDWSNGEQQNSAWYEMYPNPSYQITGFPLDVGDVIQAEVVYQGNSEFKLSMVNHTKQVYIVIPGNLTKSTVAKRSSAEWILEAPYLSEVLPLSDFQEVPFTNCTTTINNVTGGIANKDWETDALTMASPSGAVKAVPSGLSADNENFTVTWKSE